MSAVTVHRYVADHTGGPDHRGDYPCQCGLPARNRNRNHDPGGVAALDQQAHDHAEAERHRLGEHD